MLFYYYRRVPPRVAMNEVNLTVMQTYLRVRFRGIAGKHVIIISNAKSNALTSV